jgi:hypothetical protein
MLPTPLEDNFSDPDKNFHEFQSYGKSIPAPLADRQGDIPASET